MSLILTLTKSERQLLTEKDNFLGVTWTDDSLLFTETCESENLSKKKKLV